MSNQEEIHSAIVHAIKDLCDDREECALRTLKQHRFGTNGEECLVVTCHSPLRLLGDIMEFLLGTPYEEEETVEQMNELARLLQDTQVDSLGLHTAVFFPTLGYDKDKLGL